MNPFSNDIDVMTQYLHRSLVNNQTERKLEQAGLSNEFKSCTIFIYHTLSDIRLESSMRWNCEMLYDIE